MTQELIKLKQSILEHRYDDALEIIDDLEEMSKQATLRKAVEIFALSGKPQQLLQMSTQLL